MEIKGQSTSCKGWVKKIFWWNLWNFTGCGPRVEIWRWDDSLWCWCEL